MLPELRWINTLNTELKCDPVSSSCFKSRRQRERFKWLPCTFMPVMTQAASQWDWRSCSRKSARTMRSQRRSSTASGFEANCGLSSRRFSVFWRTCRSEGLERIAGSPAMQLYDAGSAKQVVSSQKRVLSGYQIAGLELSVASLDEAATGLLPSSKENSRYVSRADTRKGNQAYKTPVQAPQSPRSSSDFRKEQSLENPCSALSLLPGPGPFLCVSPVGHGLRLK